MLADIFGFKRRSRERIENYKTVYRAMNELDRKREACHLMWTVRNGVFRNQAVIEQLKAAAEVETEEADAACTQLKV